MAEVRVIVVDKGANKLFDALRKIDSSDEAVAGWPRSSVGSGLGTSVAEYMQVNNDGTQDGKIPARPFMDEAWARNVEKYGRHFDQGVDRIEKGTPPERVLMEAAVEAHNDIKRTILQGPWKDNEESTIARKGSSRPLVDTGAALQSVTFEVRKKEPES